MAKKDGKKGKMDPLMLTPEYIAEQRRLRELKKAQLLAERIANGENPENEKVPPALRFIRRPLLDIPGQKPNSGLPISIMTYNVLAQALIRRSLFPTNGSALKWGNRSQVLLSEFKHYDCDILCLQELDFIQYNSFWKLELARLGYLSQYYRSGTKNHGVAIFYKQEKFIHKNSMHINYDKEDCGAVRNSTPTLNVGLMVYLEFSETVLKKCPSLSRDGIIVGTTHLFWHPFGTYERSRQTFIVLKQMKEFTRILNLVNGGNKSFYRFFAGDFNSQPFDTPYLSITAKPVKYTSRAKNVIGRGLAHDWNKKKSKKRDGEENLQPNHDCNEAANPQNNIVNVKHQGEDLKEESISNDDEELDLDDNPVPENFVFTGEALEKIHQMEQLHNDLDMRAISLYSVGYHLVHKENSGLDNDRREPFFSNWAHAWRGLLDYIFVIDEWDKEESFTNKIDTLEDLEQKNHVKLLGLVRLPTAEEMGPEPSGQPRAGQYPSDHLCMIAKIELV